MLFTKLKVAAACGALALGAAGTTVGVARYAHGDDPRPGGPPAVVVKPDPAKPAEKPAVAAPGARIDKLRRERLDALRERAKALRDIVENGAVGGPGAGLDPFGDGGLGSGDRDMLEAELELAPDAAARVKIRERMVESAAFWERFMKLRSLGGIARESVVAKMTAARLAAEIALEQERAAAPVAPGPPQAPARGGMSLPRHADWSAVTPSRIEEAKAEARKLAGTWEMQSLTVDGKAKATDGERKFWLTLGPSAAARASPKLGAPEPHVWLANARVAPKQLLVCATDENNPTRALFSYELQGDTLRLASYAESDVHGAPAGFDADADPAAPRLYVATYKRSARPGGAPPGPGGSSGGPGVGLPGTGEGGYGPTGPGGGRPGMPGGGPGTTPTPERGLPGGGPGPGGPGAPPPGGGGPPR